MDKEGFIIFKTFLAHTFLRRVSQFAKFNDWPSNIYTPLLPVVNVAKVFTQTILKVVSLLLAHLNCHFWMDASLSFDESLIHRI